MKEKYVWLSSKELQLLLQGSLQWIDILPRITSSKAGMRKLGESLGEASDLMQTNPMEPSLSQEKGINSKRLEGQPVIWLLGSVGFLTLSSWFYFVLFTK